MANVDVLAMIERLAEYGTAPNDGCALFGVGYDEAFARLRSKYLEARFARGDSAEKFIIGPFGSGKTHFLRQLMELARDLDCVTAEVALNKDLDFTKSLVVYREVTRELRVPGAAERGIPALLNASLEQVRSKAAGNDALADRLVAGWVAGLDKADFELETSGRVAQAGLEAALREDEATFTAACRWLEGDVADRALARQLALTPVAKSEENLYGRRMLLTLCQFIRSAGFRGTVIGYDEAEQGLDVPRRDLPKILSRLQSNINGVADLQHGSALVLYAFEPSIVERLDQFPALQQRVADPGPGYGFFEGNTLAARIDLTRRDDPVHELRAIGRRLAELSFQHAREEVIAQRRNVLALVDDLAEEIATADPTSASRRTMVKRTCAMLVRLQDEGILDTGEVVFRPDAVEDEV
jgi:hypothetical protein